MALSKTTRERIEENKYLRREMRRRARRHGIQFRFLAAYRTQIYKEERELQGDRIGEIFYPTILIEGPLPPYEPSARNLRRAARHQARMKALAA